MIGILILLWAGRTYYQLAHEYNKNRWVFGILGVVAYYAGSFLGAFVLAIVLELYYPGYINESNETWIGYLGIPFGILTCWLIYVFLKKSWSAPKDLGSSPTLDAELTRYNKGER